MSIFSLVAEGEDNVLINDISFKQRTDFLEIPNDTAPLMLKDVNNGIIPIQIDLQANKSFSIVARGLLGGSGADSLNVSIIEHFF